jgi:hypothetical protein
MVKRKPGSAFVRVPVLVSGHWCVPTTAFFGETLETMDGWDRIREYIEGCAEPQSNFEFIRNWASRTTALVLPQVFK